MNDNRRTFIKAAPSSAVPALALAAFQRLDARSGGSPPAAGGINVRDHGAVGDGVKLNTRAIQAAIDACAAAGGGTVLVPEGTYLTGTIVLNSYVTLHLAPKATLLGSKNLDDYPPMEGRAGMPRRVLVYAHGLERIGLEGSGTIDGQGAAFDRLSRSLFDFAPAAAPRRRLPPGTPKSHRLAAPLRSRLPLRRPAQENGAGTQPAPTLRRRTWSIV
jgi:hypothetical protein